MMMKKNMKRIFLLLMVLSALFAAAVPALAAGTDEPAAETAVSESAEAAEEQAVSAKAIAAAVAVGLAAAGGAIGMGWAIAKSVEGIARQPEAEGKIRTTLMLGLVFVETAIIYALVIAILIVFVL